MVKMTCQSDSRMESSILVIPMTITTAFLTNVTLTPLAELTDQDGQDDFCQNDQDGDGKVTQMMMATIFPTNATSTALVVRTVTPTAKTTHARRTPTETV